MPYKIGIIFLFVVIFSLSNNSTAQTLTGKVVVVTDTITEPLSYAIVYWINSSVGTTSDSSGTFSIPVNDIIDKRLIVNSLGYISDTISIADQTSILIQLQANPTAEIVIQGKQANTYGTAVINQAELKKAACCDLAGCFETQATVQPMTTNIITNSKELRILGLSGVYNQVLIDGMPLIQGLSYTYGISSIPGTLVDNIYIAKGANSVLQGFESISGSINVILKQPDNTNKLLLNAYMNSFLEKHLNANYSKRWNKWSTLGTFHMVQPAKSLDRDKDTFIDIAKLTRYMLYNKWKYSDEDSLGWSTMIGLRYLHEQRVGGQIKFDVTQKGSSTVYGQTMAIDQPELYTKTGYRLTDDKKITLIASSFYQNQESYFGTIHYKAQQYNAYGNLQYELRWKEKHELKMGISIRYMNRTENINFTSGDFIGRTYTGTYLKKEIIPGVFAENIFQWKGDKIAWIIGMRLDHHNTFGFFLTPRTQFKYELARSTTMRLSAGTGWRTLNLFSENINLLASSRDIVITEELNPEQAFNWGINLSQDISAENVKGILSLDFYQTRFSNQIFPDYDSDPQKAFISNYTGTSISNGFQMEGNFTFHKRFTAKLAYTFLNVFRMQQDEKYVLPFNARYKVMGSFSYMPLTKAWHADVNIHWFGEQRLPNTSSNPVEYQRPEKSDPYTIVSAQFTKTWKKLEVYGGCENIFDFRQLRPILGWQDPFGPYFDSSFAWGPTRGREFYLGIRFMID